MREIKFRGISIKTGEFVYGLLLKNGFHKVYITGFGAYEGTAYPFQRMNELVEEVTPETVGQFTGLKDKNGKEVYEGDIDLANCNIYSRIVWKKGGFWITWHGREKPLEVFLTPKMDKMLNIVGNIHQNANLLEEK